MTFADIKKPMLKWAGGKRWLLPTIQSMWIECLKLNPALTLVEPFTGGMAIALGLNPINAILNDTNPHLINFYRQVQRGLRVPNLQNEARFYYQARDRFNQLIYQKAYRNAEAAALFYYLIRTGFNGLCRFNAQGEFNVPFGQHANISYKADFLDYRPLLKPWQFHQGDFETLSKVLQGKEFLYVDPPYDEAFTQYHAQRFSWEDQCRLAEWLAKHPGPVIASNHATPRVLTLYKQLGFKVTCLSAPRRISCTGNRSPVQEILAVRMISKSRFLG